MPELIKAQIDVLKINKSRLFKGSKGTYLNLMLIPTPNSEYGDWMICEGVSKEEREKGVKGAILGNAKKLVKGGAPQRSATQKFDNKDDVVY